MPRVSEQEIITFSQEFEKCLENLGNDEVAIDSTSLRNLISLNRNAAWDFVELYCFMARDKPAYIMTAYIVAIVYQIEFGDDSLEKIVLERAKALNATEYLLNIRTSL